MDIRFENEMSMSAKELWRTLQTPEFNAFMAGEFEPYPHIKLETQSSGDLLYRRLRIDLSNVDLPDIACNAAHKLLGGNNVIYEEIQEKDLDRLEMSWNIRPPVVTEKFQASGVLKLTPVDGSRCVRVMDGSIYVRLFGLGRVLEHLIAQQARSLGDQFSKLMETWKSEDAKSGEELL